MITPTPNMVSQSAIPQSFRNPQQQLQVQRNRKQASQQNTEIINAEKIHLLDVPKGPSVTVFVGNLTERAPDLMVRHMLSACGPVVSWKRVQGGVSFF